MGEFNCSIVATLTLYKVSVATIQRSQVGNAFVTTLWALSYATSWKQSDMFRPNCIFLKDIFSELFKLLYNTNNDVIIISYYFTLLLYNLSFA